MWLSVCLFYIDFCLSIHFSHLKHFSHHQSSPPVPLSPISSPFSCHFFSKSPSPGLPDSQVWPAASCTVSVFLLQLLKSKLQLTSFHQLHKMILFGFHVNFSKTYVVRVLCHLVFFGSLFKYFLSLYSLLRDMHFIEELSSRSPLHLT